MKRVRAAVTGSREGMSAKQLDALYDLLASTRLSEFRFGCCRGADTEALWAWVSLGDGVGHAHPATMNPAWDALNVRIPTDDELDMLGITLHQPEHPLARNRTMVDNADVVWAFPLTTDAQHGSGTWATVHYARSKGVPVTVVLP